MSEQEHRQKLYELNLRAAYSAHDRYFSDASDLFRSVLGFADIALKASAILNGGAAVATLTFIGALLATGQFPNAAFRPLTDVLTIFGVGVLLSSLATGASYFAQINYHTAHNHHELTWEHPYIVGNDAASRSHRHGDWFRVIAIALVVASYAAFVYGGLVFRGFADDAFSVPAAAPPPIHVIESTPEGTAMDASSVNMVVAISSIAATVIGPVVAVAVTLWWESVRRSREARQLIVQTLLATRGRYADPGYSWAIRTAPLQFARNKDVMAAHAAYMNAVRQQPSPENAGQHDKEGARREGILISEMLRDLGYRGLTSEQIEAYTAQGLADRERLLEQALRSLVLMGFSADRSAKAAERMADHITPQAEQTKET